MTGLAKAKQKHEMSSGEKIHENDNEEASPGTEKLYGNRSSL